MICFPIFGKRCIFWFNSRVRRVGEWGFVLGWEIEVFRDPMQIFNITEKSLTAPIFLCHYPVGHWDSGVVLTLQVCPNIQLMWLLAQHHCMSGCVNISRPHSVTACSRSCWLSHFAKVINSAYAIANVFQMFCLTWIKIQDTNKLHLKLALYTRTIHKGLRGRVINVQIKPSRYACIKIQATLIHCNQW